MFAITFANRDFVGNILELINTDVTLSLIDDYLTDILSDLAK